MLFWNISARNGSTKSGRTHRFMAKQRHLEDFIARNKARASTAKLAQSKAKQLERLELTEIASDEPTARIRAPRVEPRKGSALRCRESGHRLSRTADRLRRRTGDRSRLARRHRRRQRSGQDDVSADHRRLAQAAGRRGSLGLWLRDRRLCPARLHQPAGEADGARISLPAGCQRQEDPGSSRHRRSLSLSRLARQEADLGSVRWRACPALPGRAAAERSQHIGSRRAGQPSRRRHGGGIWPRPCWNTRVRHFHQPRPAFHEARCDQHRGSARRPRDELQRQL